MGSLNNNEKNDLNNSLKESSLKQNIINDSFTEYLIQKNNHSNSIIPKEPKNAESDSYNLNLSRTYAFIACFFFSTSDCILKIAHGVVPGFNIYVMIFYRFFTYALCSLFFIYKEDINYTSVFNIKNKKWLFIRVVSNLMSLLTLKLSFEYIRLGLSISLLMIAPILGNLFSIFLLNEKFELKYIISCVICLAGTYIISLGEEPQNKNSNQIYIGIFFGLLTSLGVSMNMMGSKILIKIYKNSYDLNFTIGIWGSIGAFFLIFIQYDKAYFLLDYRIIIFGFFNGLSNFFANHFRNKCFSLADYSKTSFINYFQIIVGLFYGALIFKEKLGILDFVGSFIIIGYNYISAKYYS